MTSQPPVAIPADASGFRDLAEALPHLVWSSLPDGTFEHVNSRWVAYTGVTLEQLNAGTGEIGITHPDERATAIERWNRALETEEPYEIEYRLRNAATGDYRWFLGRSLPVRDESGRIVRWVGTATDIDAQRRALDNLDFTEQAARALRAELDVSAICAKLAALAIERVADWCAITLYDPQEGFRTAAVAHRDPELLEYVRRFQDRYPVRPGSPTDLAVKRNESALFERIPEGYLEAQAYDAEHLELIRHLKLHSGLVVPITSGPERTYGALALISSDSLRSFTQEDLRVAQLVARHAGEAIATALAFDEERRTARRLRFVAKASDVILEANDVQTTIDRITEFIVSGTADLAKVFLVERDDALRLASVAHRDPARAKRWELLRGARVLRPIAEERLVLSMAANEPVLTIGAESLRLREELWDYAASTVQAETLQSRIALPLYARGETFGALVAATEEGSPELSAADLPIFMDLARRLSFALDHLRTLDRERSIASALQNALLPQPGMLPKAPDLSFHVEYRASSRDAWVGGDWYDALTLPDGSILVAIGDVTGRGLGAAGLMGKLRQALGVTALYETRPARILDQVDYLLRARGSEAFATAWVGIIDRKHGRLHYASAGHPPPILRRRGELLELRTGGLPIGLRNHGGSEDQTVSLEGAEFLLLYTDGLTEATHQPVEDERRLRAILSTQGILYARNPARMICDACLPLDAKDDTAALAVVFGNRRQWSFDAENAQAAHDARAAFAGYISRHADPGADVAAAELIFGELIGNVVRHAPGPIDVQVDWSGKAPILHVTDRGHGIIRDPLLPHPFSESGRGLFIVSQLSSKMEIERIPGYGNHIAVTLKL